MASFGIAYIFTYGYDHTFVIAITIMYKLLIKRTCQTCDEKTNTLIHVGTLVRYLYVMQTLTYIYGCCNPPVSGVRFALFFSAAGLPSCRRHLLGSGTASLSFACLQQVNNYRLLCHIINICAGMCSRLQ